MRHMHVKANHVGVTSGDSWKLAEENEFFVKKGTTGSFMITSLAKSAKEKGHVILYMIGTEKSAMSKEEVKAYFDNIDPAVMRY